MLDPVTDSPVITRSQAAIATAVIAATGPALGASSAAAVAVTGIVVAQAGVTKAAPLTNSEKLQKVWGASMKDVSIKPYADITWHKPLADMAFGAWTNSAKAIYMRDHTAFGFTDAFHFVVLYHEGWHVKQFLKHGGYPKSYQQMMEFEVEAYGESAKWLSKNGAKYQIDKKDVASTAKTYLRLAKGLKDELAIVAKSNKPAAEKEATLKTFLEGGGRNKVGLDATGNPEPDPFLPTHTSLQQLYGYKR